MKIKSIIYFIVILILDFSICLKNPAIQYDTLEYMKEIEYTLNNPNSTEMIFYVKIDVDSILTDKCLINIRQTDPQSINLEYKFENGQEALEFKTIKNWLTINDGSQHVLLYDIEKPKEKGYTLFMKVSVKGYKLNQVVRVISTDHQFNFFLIIGIVIGAGALITGVAIFLSYYCVYKKGINPNDMNNEIIFAKVGPEDY